MVDTPETSDRSASVSEHGPEIKASDPSSLDSTPPSPSLWPFRLWYLSSFSAFSCLSPYLVLYYHSVGLTQGQIGILLVMQPFISIPMGALWGALVDRLQQEKPVLLLTIIINALIRFSLLFASTFSQFCMVLVALYTVSSPAQLLGDVLALRALPDKSNYGKLRMWGAVGWGIFSPVGGLIMSQFGIQTLFFCYLALMGVTAAVTTQLPVVAHPSSQGSTRRGLSGKEYSSALKQLLSSPSVLVFFCVVVIMGMAMGSMQSYMFLYLQELGAKPYLMGLTNTVMCLAEAPAMFLSGHAVRYFGVDGVLCIVLCAYIIRLCYYSVLWTPWMVLPIELLHGITFGWGLAVGWRVVLPGTMHAGSIAPQGLGATTQSLFNTAMFSVGAGAGNLGAGYVYEKFGAVIMFRTMATLLFCALLVFAPTSRFVKQKSHSTLEESLLKVSEEPVVYVDEQVHRNLVVGAEMMEEEREEAMGRTVKE